MVGTEYLGYFVVQSEVLTEPVAELDDALGWADVRLPVIALELLASPVPQLAGGQHHG